MTLNSLLMVCSRGREPRPCLVALLVIFGFAICGGAHAGDVTWGNAYPTTVGVATTVPLGGGSTVDLTVTTGGTQGLVNSSIGSAGSVETGLGYADLSTLNIFNGGGSGTVATTLVFSNFNPGPGHLRGFVMVGALDEDSSFVTVTSSVPGAVQSWPQVGTSFLIDMGNQDPIGWTAVTGEVTHGSGSPSVDSGGLVIDVGSITQYGTITLSLSQSLADGVRFSFGEEVATPVPLLTAPLLMLVTAALLVSGLVLTRRSTDR